MAYDNEIIIHVSSKSAKLDNGWHKIIANSAAKIRKKDTKATVATIEYDPIFGFQEKDAALIQSLTQDSNKSTRIQIIGHGGKDNDNIGSINSYDIVNAKTLACEICENISMNSTTTENLKISVKCCHGGIEKNINKKDKTGIGKIFTQTLVAFDLSGIVSARNNIITAVHDTGKAYVNEIKESGKFSIDTAADISHKEKEHYIDFAYSLITSVNTIDQDYIDLLLTDENEIKKSVERTNTKYAEYIHKDLINAQTFTNNKIKIASAILQNAKKGKSKEELKIIATDKIESLKLYGYELITDNKIAIKAYGRKKEYNTNGEVVDADIADTDHRKVIAHNVYEKNLTATKHDIKIVEDKYRRRLIQNIDAYLLYHKQHSPQKKYHFLFKQHGNKGIKRAQELKKAILKAQHDKKIHIPTKLKDAFKKSGKHSHSLSRYLYAAAHNLDHNSVTKLSEKEFNHKLERRKTTAKKSTRPKN